MSKVRVAAVRGKKSNDPQVVLVTSGPGATNLLTCIITVYITMDFQQKKARICQKVQLVGW